MSLIYVLPVALGHLINSLSEAIAATAHDRISLRVVASCIVSGLVLAFSTALVSTSQVLVVLGRSYKLLAVLVSSC